MRGYSCGRVIAWYIETPDGDTYVEDITCPGGDECPVRAFVCSDRRRAPAEVKGKFYRFNEHPDLEELTEEITDARAVVKAGFEDVRIPKEMVSTTGRRGPLEEVFADEDDEDEEADEKTQRTKEGEER